MGEMSPSLAPVIRVVAGVIVDAAGRMLLVRKAGSQAFMQPGGKPEAGEVELATLAREIREELGCRILPESARFIGRFRASAANEPGHVVEAAVYQVRTEGVFQPEREIAELAWLELDAPCALTLAPLTEHLILPAVRRLLGDESSLSGANSAA